MDLEKVNVILNKVGRPIAVYLAVLCTFWVVHYPLIWAGWMAFGLSDHPGADPGFHHFVATARTVIDAPIYPFYRVPYWVFEAVTGHTTTWLWMRMVGLVFLLVVGTQVLLSPFVLIAKIFGFFRRIFMGPSD